MRIIRHQQKPRGEKNYNQDKQKVNLTHLNVNQFLKNVEACWRCKPMLLYYYKRDGNIIMGHISVYLFHQNFNLEE